MTRPKGDSSASDEGTSKVVKPRSGDVTHAVRDSGAASVSEPSTDELLDARDERQARKRKKQGPTRTPPADPPVPATDAPPTEI